MDEIFLHPPFDAADLLKKILGPGAPPASRPATLARHAVAADADGLRFALVPAAGEAVAGRLLALSAVARRRLDFAMAALGTAPLSVTVEASGRVAVTGYGPGPDAELAAGWPPLSAEARARLGETLEEVMGHFGGRTREEMPALVPGIAIRALGRVRGALTETPAVLAPEIGDQSVETVRRRFAYARYFGVEEHLLRHRRFDGGMSEVVERSVFTSGDAVTVLPFDPRAGTVLLIAQFRPGPYARRDPRPWCLETVAGRSDHSEAPEATARREAIEEAGLTLGRLERIGGYYPSPGIASEYIVAFVAEADLGGAGGSTHGLAEEHEDIRTMVVTLDAAMAALEAGEIRNAPLMLSLLWLDRHAARLLAAWA
ncbi:MAG: NUDIX domain-containing protein [Amaricoccus sp.]